MNTMDALRLSVVEGEVIKAQAEATKLELMFEGFIQLEKISPFPALKSRLLCAASAYKAVAERIEKAANATEPKDLTDAS